MSDQGTREDLEAIIIASVIESCIPALHPDVYRWTAECVRARLDVAPEQFNGDPAVYRWVSGWRRKLPGLT